MNILTKTNKINMNTFSKNKLNLKNLNVRQTNMNKTTQSQTKPPIYVVDFLNTFSDFREIKYKMSSVDFHKVKHKNKDQDTCDFFELFFSKYISSANIDVNGVFMFIMKKITNYEETLYKILEKYKEKDIRFVVIESKYNVDILDKNKDDFICQYISSFLKTNNTNCILISNDKYRDKKQYVKQFKTVQAIVSIIKKSTDKQLIENSKTTLDFEKLVCENILSQNCSRCSVPKNKIHTLL